MLGTIQATVRTNAYLPVRSSLSIKLRSADVPDMPKPFPLFEIFVYSPEMEAIHLRGGMVARGGIRWSDRREDYRTEVLGLMKAQKVKNADHRAGRLEGWVRPAAESADARSAQGGGHEAVRDVHARLARHHRQPRPGNAWSIRSTFGCWTGTTPTSWSPPTRGRRRSPTPRTACSAEYGFWLGDAFASGGSAGFDHKELGITARGAWESVKRHFRELGIDVMATPFSVVGIGDMSGDVFGNGMLLSPFIKLVAAFDHRHVFVDPDPDPAVSFEERRGCSTLPGSSWDDYDRTSSRPPATCSIGRRRA